MSEDDVRKELEETKKKLAILQARDAKGISYKVSEKGPLSVYGLGRFPVTLYKEQWTRLLDASAELREFMTEIDAQLKAKE